MYVNEINMVPSCGHTLTYKAKSLVIQLPPTDVFNGNILDSNPPSPNYRIIHTKPNKTRANYNLPACDLVEI